MSQPRADPRQAVRPRGRLRHYAGLLGPAGATAAGVVARDHPRERLSAIRAGIASRRGPRQRGLVAGPGGRFELKDVPAPPPPRPRAATVHPIAIATCDMDRPIMLGHTPFPLPLHLGHECVADVPEPRILIVASLRARQAFTASMPIYTGLVALALGARRVELVDARAPVRDLAMKLGMRSLPPSEMRSLSPAPLVVDVTAEAKGLAACLERTAPDGICSSAGGLHSSARIPFVRTYIRNATLHLGRTHARAVIPDVLALLADGRLRPEVVTTQIAAFDDASAALREHC